MLNNCFMNKSVTKIIFSLILCLCFLFLSACSEEKDKNNNNLIANPVLSESSYALGDYMGDYTVTDVNGNEYTFSKLLESKKAIVLNFWFINCGPCQMEFPYLQAAADKYNDDIVVLAINPTDDRENKIKDYAESNELSLPFIKGEQDWITAFNLQGFPTTVVIDSYGKIAFSHVGAVTQEGLFEDMFAFFSSDDYEHTIIKNINDF